MKQYSNIITIGSIIICSMILMSCQTKMFTYEGAVAKPEIRLPLVEGGIQNGSWETGDVRVDYQYEKNQNNLKISGEIYLKTHYSYIGSFYMRINFLDKDNRILESRLLQSHPYRSHYYGLGFQSEFELDFGTDAVGFSYSGVIRGHSDDGAWDFLLDPRRANRYGFFY